MKLNLNYCHDVKSYFFLTLHVYCMQIDVFHRQKAYNLIWKYTQYMKKEALQIRFASTISTNVRSLLHHLTFWIYSCTTISTNSDFSAMFSNHFDKTHIHRSAPDCKIPGIFLVTAISSFLLHKTSQTTQIKQSIRRDAFTGAKATCQWNKLPLWLLTIYG